MDDSREILSFLTHSIKVGDQANIDKALELSSNFLNNTKESEPKERKFNHAYTVGFEVISSHEDSGEIQEHEILKGLVKRVGSLIEEDCVLESCEPYDCYEETH